MLPEMNVLTNAAKAFCSDEQACRLILHNLQDGIILINKQLKVVYCNRTANERTRQNLHIDIYPGMCILELADETKRPVMRELYTRVLKGHSHTTETKCINDAGQPVFYENGFQPAYDGNNNIAGIIIFSKDIIIAKESQHVIRESEERLQFALEAASQGAWDWNLVTNEVIYSSSYKKLYGFEEGDLKNHVSEWMTRIHPDDQQKMQESIQEHLKADNHEYGSQYRIRAKDGSYRWVMAKGRLVAFDENGRPLRMIGTHTDITDAVKREQALKEMNDRFACMLKATHELLWEWDIPDNYVKRAKDAVEKVYGVSDDSSIRTIESWLRRVHPDEQPGIENTLDQILAASHYQTFEMEYRFRRDDGEYSHIYDRCILLKDEKNNPVRLIGAAQDISDRKKLEKELIKAELDYQRLIHQATVDSQEKERAEIGKELHDNVNQVLTTTKLYLDLALTKPALKEDLIRKGLVNINNVIQDIRHLSRSLMDPSIGDLGLIASINDLIENIHLTEKLRIIFREDNSIEELLDANQKLTLFRIIQESLSNVLRHAKAATVMIDIITSPNEVKLIIEDDGIGLGKDTVKKGAGLKNIQNRIYLIHGTLQLQSKPGEGCTLELQFPIKITTKT